jgi:hypothetical protein
MSDGFHNGAFLFIREG